MARPREFDPVKALRGATDVFWRKGFKGTNLPDLLQAMQLTRGSFYKAYHTKENVYGLALDRYNTDMVDVVVAQLGACQEANAWDCLAPMFGPPAPDRRGCFICNAMVELAPDYPEIADKARHMAERLRQAIEGVLLRHDPDLSKTDAEQTSDLILHLYFGHQAMGKAGGSGTEWTLKLRDLILKR